MFELIISFCSVILIMYSSQKMRSLLILTKTFKKNEPCKLIEMFLQKIKWVAMSGDFVNLYNSLAKLLDRYYSLSHRPVER